VTLRRFYVIFVQGTKPFARDVALKNFGSFGAWSPRRSKIFGTIPKPYILYCTFWLIRILGYHKFESFVTPTMKYLAIALTTLFMIDMPCLAQDSAACVTETESLMDNNLAVESAYDALEDSLEAAISANPETYCSILNKKCSINVGDFSSSLKTTCEAEAGQFVEKDVTATCGGILSSVSTSGFTIVAEAAPLCAGTSCDPDAIPTAIEAYFNTTVSDIVDEVSDVFLGNLQCSLQIGSGSGGSGGGDTAAPGATPAPNSGGESAPAPTPSGAASTPTSGAQATTIWVGAAGVTLVSSILM
jgi:hypothetical protein